MLSRLRSLRVIFGARECVARMIDPLVVWSYSFFGVECSLELWRRTCVFPGRCFRVNRFVQPSYNAPFSDSTFVRVLLP